MALKCLQESISGKDQAHRFMERLFSFFFPVDSTNCSTDDCFWFLSYANNQRELVFEIAKYKSNQELCQNVDGLSIYIFKLYLCRILGEKNGDNTTSSNPLAFYNDRVSFIMYMQE